MTLVIQKINGDLEPVEFSSLTDKFQEIVKTEIAALEKRLNEPESERFLNVNEASQFLNVSVATIRRLKERIDYTHIAGRLMFKKSDLEDYIQRRTINKK